MNYLNTFFLPLLNGSLAESYIYPVKSVFTEASIVYGDKL